LVSGAASLTVVGCLLQNFCLIMHVVGEELLSHVKIIVSDILHSFLLNIIENVDVIAYNFLSWNL